MKIIIPGGTGQVGSLLARAFYRAGHEVIILSRRPSASQWREVFWDAKSAGEWCKEIDAADAVINLAGRSVNCRYNPENRREIIDSRVDSTRAVGEAIARSNRPPRVWLQMSTATIYAHRYDAPNDEATGILGGSEESAPDTWRFSIDVAKAWEKALDDADTPGTRKVKMRAAMVMSPDREGVFDKLLQLTRLGLGGQAGDGRQYVSWIHHHDFVNAVRRLIESPSVSGAVNLSAPNPLPNAEFMRILRTTWGARFGLPAAGWMLEVGAVMMKTETELILKSRRVIPGKLLEDNFNFQFPNWADAANDLCREWRASNRTAPEKGQEH